MTHSRDLVAQMCLPCTCSHSRDCVLLKTKKKGPHKINTESLQSFSFCVSIPFVIHLCFRTRFPPFPSCLFLTPPSLSHSVSLAAPGCLTAAPLPARSGALSQPITNLMCVLLISCLLDASPLLICICAIRYKCSSCPFL